MPKDRQLDDLLGRRIGTHFGVGEEVGALRRYDERQRGKIIDARRITDDIANMAQVIDETALDAANQRVGIAELHHQRSDDSRIGAQQRARGVWRDALAARNFDVALHIGAVTRVVLRVDQYQNPSRPDRQAEPH